MIYGWDTETHLIRPGMNAPELACLSWASQDGRSGLLSRDDAPRWLAERMLAGDHLVAHNLAYDTSVLCAHAPSLLRQVFAHYAAGLFGCTMLRQKLIDLSRGELKFYRDDRGVQKTKHSLDDTLYRWRGRRLDKDTWRLRYHDLSHLPLAEWPEGAVRYATDDAIAHLEVWLCQEAYARQCVDSPLLDEAAQTRRYFALRLTECWGLRTQPARVAAFAADLQIRFDALREELVPSGLMRDDDTKAPKEAAARMLTICAAKGIEPILTDTAQKADDAKRAELYARGQGVTIDADTCERSGDALLVKYSNAVKLKALLSKDVTMLRKGVALPVHTRYGFAETGRTTSSDPNVQNPRREAGVRECFVPREGHWFFSSDYPAIESRTWAQVLHWLFGQTPLGDALRAGMDPHLKLAANMGRTTYEDIKAQYKAKDKGAAKLRQFAKIGNYGFQGGMGAETFIEYAAANGVKLAGGIDEATWIRNAWFETWPEARAYFDVISRECGDTPDGATVKQFISQRIRGKVRFTANANGKFQGLAADIGARAVWEVSREQYAVPDSALYGTKSVLFVHDEIIGEVVAIPQVASAAVLRLCEVMRQAANAYLPDIPLPPGSVKPTLAECWSKAAESSITDDGLVTVWKEESA